VLVVEVVINSFGLGRRALLEFFLEAVANQKNDCPQADLLAEMKRLAELKAKGKPQTHEIIEGLFMNIFTKGFLVTDLFVN
jgi:hypothetical protein